MQDNKPLVTVIVPVYNVEQYIGACLDSIVNQTYRNLQIICVDDCTPDKSMDVVEKYASRDNRIKIIRHKENQGLSAARNSGLDIAEGKFVIFVDSDDELGQMHAIEKAVNHFTDDVDAVWFGIGVVHELPGNQKKFVDEPYYELHVEGKTTLTDKLLLKHSVNAVNRLFRLSVINKYSLRFPTGLIFEDNVFYWNYFSVVNKVWVLRDKFYTRYRRSGSIMSTVAQKKENYSIQHFLILSHIHNFWKKNNLLKNREPTFLELCHLFFYFAWNNAPDFERVRVLWTVCHSLRTWNLDCSQFEVLQKIKTGDYKIDFFPQKAIPNSTPVSESSPTPEPPPRNKKRRKLGALEKILFIGNEGNKKVIRLFSFRIFSKKRKTKSNEKN